jgi:hypothetical protein
MPRVRQPEDPPAATADAPGNGAWHLPPITPEEVCREFQMRHRVRQSPSRYYPPAVGSVPAPVALPPLTREEVSRQLQMRSCVLRWKSQRLRRKSAQLFACAQALHTRVEAFVQERHWSAKEVSPRESL